jgi:hypothetical protein
MVAGCVSPNVKVERARAALASGNDAPALAWAEKLKDSFYSKDLGYLEAGRVRMLGGDFVGSSTNFSAAIDIVLEQTETGPRVKLGDMGANVLAGTVTDDRTRPYRLPPYEFIHALQYQMLNRVFLGDLEGAAVEARRAVFAQDQVAEKYGADVEAGRAAAEKKQEKALQRMEAQLAAMDAVESLSRSSYENPLAWWFCGILFEEDKDMGNARLAYQKARELAPGNPYIQRDMLRVLRSEDQDSYKRLLEETGADAQSCELPETGLVVVFEDGFVPQRLSKKIPLPLPVGNTVVSLDYPIYKDSLYESAPVVFAAGGTDMGQASFALSVQSLAYRDLRERMPGIVARNVTRAAVRGAAAAAAKSAADNDGTGIGSAIYLLVSLFNGVSAVANRADTRAWYTLPMAANVWRGGIGPGEHTLVLRHPLTGLEARVPVTVARGETRLVWMVDTGGNLRAANATLRGKGAPAAFGVYNSVVNTGVKGR